jgi:protein O-mannosyl-transferase
VKLASVVRRLLPVAIPLFVLVAFWPTLQADFIQWDDDANFLHNPHFRGLDWANLRWMLTTFRMGNYQPLGWLALCLQHSLWGMHPLGYHATSLGLHMLNAVLFYFVAARLLRRAAAADDGSLLIAAAFAALVFALHPLRVESVAWLSDQHDLQAGALYLLAVLCYLRAAADPPRARRWRVACAVLFAAGLLAKINGITLPLALLLLDAYPLRRLPLDPRQWLTPEHRRVFGEKLPLLILALAAGLAGWASRQDGGALVHFPLGFRIQQACYGLTFYLVKTLVPIGLVPCYPVPADFRLPPATFAITVALVVVITAMVLYLRRRWPAGWVAWLFYVVTLLPVLGLVSFSAQLVADRYSYLPGLAWAMLAGAAVGSGLRRLGRPGRLVLTAGLGAGLLVLAGLSFRQTQPWRDSETLFRHALAIDPNIPELRNNLGLVLVGQLRTDEAIAEYRQALGRKPDFTRAMNNLGLALLGQGRHAEAVEEFQKALAVEPDYAFGHNNLGLALMYLERPAQALPHFETAVALAPDYVMARSNLGGALLMLGRIDEAIAQYRQALALRPDFAAAATMLRIAEAQRQQP